MNIIYFAVFVLLGLTMTTRDSHAQENKQPWFRIIKPAQVDIPDKQEVKNAQVKAVPAMPTNAIAPVNKDLLAVLLSKADALMKGGKATEAYALLEPEEDEYSGETGYDYLLGISALDSGKPDRATIAFERVLMINPNFAGARIDLARAYVTMGSDDLAQKEFETVLMQRPPPQVAAVVRKFLGGIDERRKAKIQQVTYYLESSAGYDDNITAATPDNIGGVAQYLGYSRAALQALDYRPTGASLKYKGMYENVSSGLDFTRKVNEENGVSLFAGVDVKKRFFNTLAVMNNANMDMRAGVSMTREENIYRVMTIYSKYIQNGFPTDSNPNPVNNNRNTSGISTEWKRSFGERNQMTWSLQYSQPRSEVEANRTQDTNQVALSASLLHIFEGGKNPLIFANLSRSVDRAVRKMASGSDMSRNGTSLMVHSQITPMPNIDFFLSGGLSLRQDDSPNARSSLTTDFYARDLTRNLSAGVTARPWSKWTIKGTIAWTNNFSNLDLYKYQKLDSSISVRRDF